VPYVSALLSLAGDKTVHVTLPESLQVPSLRHIQHAGRSDHENDNEFLLSHFPPVCCVNLKLTEEIASRGPTVTLP
jgi:hypothetical protein